MQQNFEGIQSYLNRLQPGVVSSLPGSPSDGDEVYYQNAAMATAGIMWHLRYRSAASGSYKWEVIGAEALMAEVAPQESYGSGVTSYGNLATAGPAITLPLAGDYIVEIGCIAYHDTTARAAWMSYQIGGTGASDNDGTYVYAGATNTVYVPTFRPRMKTGLGAVTLTAKYRSDGSGIGTYAHRWIRATPVRVG